MGTADANNSVASAADGSGTFGSGVTMSGSIYNAGTIDFLALSQDSSDFTDANGVDLYKIGTFSQTTGGESYIMYQVAGVQGWTDAGSAVVKGNYIFGSSDVQGLVAAESGTTGLADGDSVDNDGL